MVEGLVGKMMDICVSVIIPVYNIKNYLDKCIESICRQTFKNLEIIIVDDGSTDGSSDICDELARKDARILVIHKTNEGSLLARKTGMMICHGEYILFLDGDDWIEDTMVENLLRLAWNSKADLVTSGYFRDSGAGCTKHWDSVPEGVYKKNDKKYLYERLIYNQSVSNRGFSPYLWNKLFHKPLLEKIYSMVSNKIVLGDDGVITYACLVISENVVVTHNSYYHYVMRSDSLSHNVCDSFFSGLNDIYTFLKDIFEKNEYSMILLAQLELYIASSCLIAINTQIGNRDNVRIPYYNFIDDDLPEKSRVILYGAGMVGKAYYVQLNAEKKYKIVSWVDMKYKFYREKGYRVESLENIDNYDYDYIVLAFKELEAAESIKTYLIEQRHVLPSKIVWKEPTIILDRYGSSESLKFVEKN